MKRTRNILGLTAAALALVALTGCAGGDEPESEVGTADTEAPAEAGAETTSDDAPEEEGGEAPTLDGEGIAYGAESITGIDLDVTCMGAGDEATLTGSGTDADGNMHSVTYAAGSFSYSVLSEDMTSSATSVIAGEEMPGTEVTADEADGGFSFTGTAEVVASDGSNGKESFTASFTCDTTV